MEQTSPGAEESEETMIETKAQCPQCRDTGWYGDCGPGMAGNNEYQRCECQPATDYGPVERDPRRAVACVNACAGMDPARLGAFIEAAEDFVEGAVDAKESAYANFYLALAALLGEEAKP